MKPLVNIGLFQSARFQMLIAMAASCFVTLGASAAFVSNSIPLLTARGGHTATLLTDGRLLVAGGQTNGGFTSSSTELYDPATGIWTTNSPMNADRAHHTATMLLNGKILVAGGYSSATTALSSAELYDPATQTWTLTGFMISPRFFHTATLLPNGQVLVVGGTTDGSTGISDAELYDPMTGIWMVTNSISSARFSHTATLLRNGQVLIVGGVSGGLLASPTEQYDPSTGTWTTSNSLTTPRYFHTATLLPIGQILVAGGTTDGSTPVSSAELYDPSTGTWTATNSLNSARFNHAATLLPNGSVLVTGGTPDGSSSLTNAEVFNSIIGTWTPASPLNSARYSHTATLLASGEVLIVGGFDTNQALSSVERYNPAAGVWTTTGPMTLPRAIGPGQTLLPNGKVLIAGGAANSTDSATAELYDPSSGTWTLTGSMSTTRSGISATPLPNRKVLVVGGIGGPGGTYLTSAETYDPITGKWTLTGSLHLPRTRHTATLLANGNVLVAGGYNLGTVLPISTELYDPTTGAWSVTGAMNAGRSDHIAVLLSNGQVLVAGGYRNDYNAIASAELYDPRTGKWTLTGNLNFARTDATATLLPDGRVLVVGGGSRGFGTGQALSSAELYDPTTGIWTLTGSLPGPRNFHRAILLPNGKTLVAGGFDGTNGATAFSSALLYDAPSGTWTETGALSVPREFPLMTLLSNGKVLIMGGQGNNYKYLSSAELYDPGLGYNALWQPQVTSVSFSGPDSGVRVTGSGFRGISEGSSGNSQDSPADYPVLELMGVAGGQAIFLQATNWSANLFSSPPPNAPPPGYLLATVFVNGIPSTAQIFKIPSLPLITNLPATAVGTGSATLNGQVLDTGGAAPAVTLYYGTTDGGTNAGAWAQSIVLGEQSGNFAQTLTNLAIDTTYYFTANATNPAGTSWATPSQSFTTITPPAVTNLPASRVQGSFATLNGQVLSTGHQTPSVTIYYGTTDGGTNANAWSQSVALGLQSGAFAQTVNSLSTNSTYFYAAAAVNVAGTNWATPSLSFTTTATNSLSSAAAVVTQHNDNSRTGMNLNETILNASNVNTNTFGLLYTRPVDDQIYAQPLLMTNVNLLGKGTHNIIIVATVNDTVYAYDADDPTAAAPYWTNSFINPPNIVPPNNADESAIGACGGNYLDFSGKFGIVGTPVIDPISGTIFLVARTKEFGTNFVQRLHALDLTTGLDRSNSPVVITATYPGTGAGSSGGLLRFDPLRHNQRAALALVNGVVYISWASHCDNGPYHGWVIGYDASTLKQAALFNDTPNGSNGGIWMSGQGPSADDAGNIYLTVGNGSVTATDYGESFLKLAPSTNSTTMTVASYFIPPNWASLNSSDLDLGTAGLLLIPGTSLAISGSKSGTLYMVNRDSMGGITNGLQSWSLGGGLYGSPVWWTGPNGSFMYVWPASGGHLRQYQFTSTFNIVPYAIGTIGGGSGTPGGILSVSANGANSGTGIIWATVNRTSSANQAVVAGTLHAYNAQNVSSELWNSDMLSRDSLGSLAKFVPPTVANGKVYVATFSGRLIVYGLSLTAANLNAATPQNQPMSIPTAKLLALTFNPYSLPLTTTTVTSISTNGGTVVLGGDAITYTPPTGYIGADRFAYTISDGQGGFASGYVFVQVMAPNQLSANMLQPSVESGGTAISFAGIPGLTYTLQRAPAVTGPWTTIATVTVPDGGIATYLDASPPLGDAFYRTTYP